MSSEGGRGAKESRRTTRLGGWSGLLFVGLFIGALVLGGTAGATENEDAGAVFATFYAKGINQTRQYLFILAMPLAAFFFVWFLHRLREVMQVAEEGDSSLSSLAFGGGLLFAGLLLVTAVVQGIVGAELQQTPAYRFDVNTALLLDDMAHYVIGVGMVGAAILLWPVSLISRRSGLLPRWLTASGFGLAVLSLASNFPLIAGIPTALFLAWIIAVSVLMIRGRLRVSAPRV